MRLRKERLNCVGTRQILGGTAGGSKLIEQTSSLAAGKRTPGVIPLLVTPKVLKFGTQLKMGKTYHRKQY